MSELPDRTAQSARELAEQCALGYGAACMELERRADAYERLRESLRRIVGPWAALGEDEK